jgi:hypothetical protein
MARRPTNNDLRAVAMSTRRRMAEATAELARARLTPTDWYFAIGAALKDGHENAYALGRRLSGDDKPRDVLDVLTAQAMLDEETYWLGRFADDLVDGRYRDETGALRTALVHARLELYVRKIRGTANEAFVEAGPPGESFEWRLTGIENHCDDCPRLAAMSPWASDELFTTPGRGGTPCLGNCKCVLVRLSDGARGFDRVDGPWPDVAEPESVVAA